MEDNGQKCKVVVTIDCSNTHLQKSVVIFLEETVFELLKGLKNVGETIVVSLKKD